VHSRAIVGSRAAYLGTHEAACAARPLLDAKMTPWACRRLFLAICALHEPVQPIVRTSEARVPARYLPHLLFEGTRPSDAVDPRLALLAEHLNVPIAARSTTESVLAAWPKGQLGIDGPPSLESVGLALLGRERIPATSRRRRPDI
jgi:hypothetical protein